MHSFHSFLLCTVQNKKRGWGGLIRRKWLLYTDHISVVFGSLDNETLIFGLVFESHHHPSPSTTVMKQTVHSTLEVLVLFFSFFFFFGGGHAWLRNLREWRTSSITYLTSSVSPSSVFSLSPCYINLKVIKWHVFRLYPFKEMFL